MHFTATFPANNTVQTSLGSLLADNLFPERFQSAIRRVHRYFDIYASTSPVLCIAPRLIVTPEIRIQSELYLPLAEIAPVFNRLYTSALNYPPTLASSPFHNALSWADTYATLPPRFQCSVNPARLLELLLSDGTLLTEFLCASFLPSRFYGGFRRYPAQLEFIRRWLKKKNGGGVRCLDAACGTGEGTYDVAALLAEHSDTGENMSIEGWTLEPLEVWAATHRCFPHDHPREVIYREVTSRLSEQRTLGAIRFRCANLVNPPPEQQFNLVLCNGLLGGPILHQKVDVERVVVHLIELLAPGGMLLAANRFHDGWKRQCPQKDLQALFEYHGLTCVIAGEGLAGEKLQPADPF